VTEMTPEERARAVCEGLPFHPQAESLSEWRNWVAGHTQLVAEAIREAGQLASLEAAKAVRGQ
jgi:hypothetical protein